MFHAIFGAIRERLLKRLSEERFRPMMQEPLGIGAAGDKIFPVDRIAEDIIIAQFESSGLPFTVISEEYGQREVNGGGRKVLVDPIDGSKNAILGIPFYCTSIAVAGGSTIGSIEEAFVLNVITGDALRGERGKEAFLNDERIATQKDEQFSLIAYEAQTPGVDIPRLIPLLSRSRKTRCLGATALDLAYLACGSISVFVSPSPSRSFDFAAGWLLVKEAGGLFTDLRGNPVEHIELGLTKSTPLLASGNRQLHDKSVRILENA